MLKGTAGAKAPQQLPRKPVARTLFPAEPDSTTLGSLETEATSLLS